MKDKIKAAATKFWANASPNLKLFLKAAAVIVVLAVLGALFS